MTDFLAKYAFPAKLLISVSLLGYCFYLIDWTVFRGISVKHGWVVGAIGLILVANLVGALRFKTLLDPIAKIKFSKHVKYYFWAGFFNSTLPTSIGGDAMRIVWLLNDGVSVNKSTFFVLLERSLGVLSLALIASLAAIYLELPGHLRDTLWGTIQILFIAAFVVLVATRWSRKLSITRRAIRLLRSTLRKMPLLAKVALIGLSFIYQGLTVIITICLALSMGIYLDWNVWFFVIPLLWLLTVLPISIGGLGVREVGLVFFLGHYSQSAEQAIALGLLTFLTYLAVGTVGGVWYSIDSQNPRRARSQNVANPP